MPSQTNLATSDFDLDMFMDLAISQAQVEHGIHPQKVARTSLLNAALFGGAEVHAPRKAPSWAPNEIEYLKLMHDKATNTQIAEYLGRTKIAVQVQRKRMHLPEMSTARTAYYTATHISNLMGLDAHKICWWIDNGLLKGHLQPGGRKIRLVSRMRFMCWVTNPENWIYFNPLRIADPDLARLLTKRAERWGDEWWPTRWVADYHGVDAKFVATHIKRGLLPGKQAAMSIGGRHADPAWLNWFVKKSDAIKHTFYTRENPRPALTARAEAWIVYARDVLGMNWTHIGLRMGRTWKRKRTTGPGIDGCTVKKYYTRLKNEGR